MSPKTFFCLTQQSYILLRGLPNFWDILHKKGRIARPAEAISPFLGSIPRDELHSFSVRRKVFVFIVLIFKK
jgi:hypothetical protein